MLSFILCILGLIYILANMQPFMNRLRGMGVGPELPRASQARRKPSSTSANDTPQEDDDSYKPTPIDVVIARILLTRGRKIPPDIVDTIFDFAEYWAHSSNEIDYLQEHRSALRIAGRSQKEDHFLLRSFPVGLTGLEDREQLADVLQYDTNETKPRPLRREHPASFFSSLANYPTPRLAHPVRKIIFTTISKDQGMGVHRAELDYENSWTWFEAGLERFDADQTCDDQCVSDLRYKSSNSVPFSLPMCALRPIYPLFLKAPKRAASPDASTEDDTKTAEPENATEPGNPDEPEYRYDHGFMPAEERLIQRNQTRHRKMKTHVVQWSWTDDVNPESDGGQELRAKGRGRATGDGQFVRDLKMGDVVTVWGKAKFPAWVNHVEKVKIEVYWAV